MKTITLTNQKGGVAKTTTSYALAAGLYRRGYSVLMIDTDPQCNLSFTCGVDLLNTTDTLYEVLKGTVQINNAVQNVKKDDANGSRLDILPGSLMLSAADSEFTKLGSAYLLQKALEKITGYDYCVIDTPPSLGILTNNALTASGMAIVPLTADIYSLQGITQLQAAIDAVQQYTNKDLTVAGLLLTRYNGNTTLSRTLEQAINDAADSLNTKVFNTRIRNTVQVGNSQLVQADLFTAAPQATATQDYDAFVTEFLEGVQ